MRQEADPRRVPGHLGAGLVGEGRREGDPALAAECLTRLLGVVEVAVPAVAVLGQLLEQVVVVVGDADADGDEPQRVAGVRVGRGLEDGEGVGGVDVRDAVGHQDDVVVGVGALPPGLAGELDPEVEPRLHVRAVVRREPLYGPHDIPVVGPAVLDGVLVEHVGGEVHDGDTVTRAEAPADGLRRLPGDVHAVAVLHRAGGVEHERHVDRRVVRHRGRLERNAGEVAACSEGVPHHIARDGEAVVVAGRVVPVVEGVDPLLRPHGVGLDRVAVPGPRQGEEVRGAVGCRG